MSPLPRASVPNSSHQAAPLAELLASFSSIWAFSGLACIPAIHQCQPAVVQNSHFLHRLAPHPSPQPLGLQPSCSHPTPEPPPGAGVPHPLHLILALKPTPPDSIWARHQKESPAVSRWSLPATDIAEKALLQALPLRGRASYYPVNGIYEPYFHNSNDS